MTQQENEHPQTDAPDAPERRREWIRRALNGEKQEAREAFACLKEQLLQADASVRVRLREDLKGSLNEIIRQSDLPPEKKDHFCEKIRALEKMHEDKQAEELECLAEALCRCIQQLRTGKMKMMESIIAYLQQHYADPCLSLSMVADHFHVSESYLSYTFKEYNGTNFFSFVEAMRIDRAKTLLRETDLKIVAIAEKTGYASANSFCRAFKRSTGDSATNYRNQGK